jgi:hypothetical protein
MSESGITDDDEPEAGYYWVRFSWGWEPCKFDGEDWLRCGMEPDFTKHLLEIGSQLTEPK